MKRKAMIAIVGTLFLVCGVTLTGLCGERDEAAPSKVYSDFVDNYIERCEAKADLLDSGSLNIRVDAMRSTVKGAFVKSNRADMIAYLVVQQVPLNAPHVDYHLNMKFAESVDLQNVYAALMKVHVIQY